MYGALPDDVRARARKAFRLWLDDHRHPSLHFKKVGKVWSARVDENFRALAKVDGETAYWFWIGPHVDYDRLLSKQRKK